MLSSRRAKSAARLGRSPRLAGFSRRAGGVEVVVAGAGDWRGVAGASCPRPLTFAYATAAATIPTAMSAAAAMTSMVVPLLTALPRRDRCLLRFSGATERPVRGARTDAGGGGFRRRSVGG